MDITLVKVYFNITGYESGKSTIHNFLGNFLKGHICVCTLACLVVDYFLSQRVLANDLFGFLFADILLEAEGRTVDTRSFSQK